MKTRVLAGPQQCLLMGSGTAMMVGAVLRPAARSDTRRAGWDQAPPEFRAAQQRGFHDGIEGARKDFENHRQPNVNNRDEYRESALHLAAGSQGLSHGVPPRL